MKAAWAIGLAAGVQAAAGANYDVIIRGGTIYDGSGSAPIVGDVAISGDTIQAMGDLKQDKARVEVDAKGMAVAPGFINMLSWANESLLEDGRSQSDIRQGVTLEIMGEGESMGPLNAAMKKDLVDQQGDIKYKVEWTTLRQYLDRLVKRGVSCNVASFVGDSRNWLRGPAADAAGIGTNESARPQGHAGRSFGRGLGTDLCAGVLRQDR